MNYMNPTARLRDAQIVSVIETVCAGLELTATREEAAKRCYEGVGDWLARSDSAVGDFDRPAGIGRDPHDGEANWSQ
jgi:hypothetical protein